MPLTGVSFNVLVRYGEGTQHTKKAQYRMSSCDTSVVFMQTTVGTRSHRVTREAMEAMRRAFRPRMTTKRGGGGGRTARKQKK